MKKSLSIVIEDSALIFRNPKPHVRSLHAYFPSLVRLRDNSLVAAFDLGSAFEAVDVRSFTARSRDGGVTWSEPEPLVRFPDNPPVSTTCRIGRAKDGTLVGFGAIFNRSRTGEGLVNPQTMGFVPMKLFLTQSRDEGRTWSKPRIVKPGLGAAAYEVCSQILDCGKGRWLAPTSTWKGWNGEDPVGMKAVVLRSDDGGKTWPGHAIVMDGADKGIFHWEIKLIELGGDRLLAVCWAHDGRAGKDLPNRYAISEDGGMSFCSPKLTGLHGQTCTPILLKDRRILCLYRRMDRPGLWANLARVEGARWINESETAIWGAATHGARSGKTTEIQAMSALRFGLPAMTRLAGGRIFAAFWCVEDGVSNIRWFRLRVK
ncbi:MAG: sialidase family protein [Kiritimatiellae bacterium]|nr:sialidase family protein [Kiritimatiellia bacterium]